MFFRKKRDIHGFLLFDKPKGISSNNALQKVKYVFHAKKAGYIGTLDPLATGVLPICFGECTKFSHYLSESNKRYSVIAKLGENTSTADSDGIVIEKRPLLFTTDKLRSSIQELIGSIKQIPPMYSAIKYYGMPLYQYARQGINITRKSRQVSIYEMDLIHQKNNLISFHIFCSKGTYIRTLIEDLGEKLGCGAHVIFLRRIKIASYSSSESVTLSELHNLLNLDNMNDSNCFKKIDKLLMPIDSPISFFQKVYLSQKETCQFKFGKKLIFPSIVKNSFVRVYEKKNKRFIGLGKINIEDVLIPYRLVSTFEN